MTEVLMIDISLANTIILQLSLLRAERTLERAHGKDGQGTGPSIPPLQFAMSR